MQQGNDDRASAGSDPPTVPDRQIEDMFARLDRAIEEQGPAARLRGLQSPLRNAIALLIAILVLGGTAAMMARPNLSPLLAEAPFLSTILLATGALLVMTSLALRPYHRPTLGSGQTVFALAGGLVAVTALALVPSGGVTLAVGHDLGGSMACLAMGSAVGGLLFVALGLLSRGQPFGLLLSGAAAALLGNVMLQLHCAAEGTEHRLLGHAGIYVLYMAVLAVLWVRKAPHHTAPRL